LQSTCSTIIFVEAGGRNLENKTIKKLKPWCWQQPSSCRFEFQRAPSSGGELSFFAFCQKPHPRASQTLLILMRRGLRGRRWFLYFYRRIIQIGTVEHRSLTFIEFLCKNGLVVCACFSSSISMFVTKCQTCTMTFRVPPIVVVNNFEALFLNIFPHTFSGCLFYFCRRMKN